MAMNKGYPKIVYLFGLKGNNSDGKKTKVSGLYEVIEFVPYEPAAYVWSDCVVLCPVEYSRADNWEDYIVDIDVGLFESQVNPKSYGRNLVVERERDIEEQLEYEREQIELSENCREELVLSREV